jgi:ABC-type Fe3+/spermidine/putrescine transport system ATPase subunit
MTQLAIEHLAYQYQEREQNTPVLCDLSLQVASGQLVALLGKSGSGKSTLLRLIAGLLTPDAGEIMFDGESVLHIKAEKRGAVMVFQENQLFPFMTVADNIAFGLKIQRLNRTQRRQRIAEALDMIQLAGYEQRYPAQLSSGQRQRIALARALAIRPRLLLLDEPLNNLDARLRENLRDEIRRLQRTLGITTLFVTHDQSEAVAIADNIALLMEGSIVQKGSPREFYERPASAAVAKFFGGSNIIPAIKQGNVIQTACGMLTVPASPLPDGEVQAVIRPEAIRMGANGRNTLQVVVKRWVYQGEVARGTVLIGETSFEITSPPYILCQPGDEITLHIPAEYIWLIEASPTNEEC